MKTIPQTIRDTPPAVRFLCAVVLLQLVLWTLVPGVLFKILPLDTLEATAWGSGFSLGNAKHPPLTGWIAGLTASATGHADWPFFLLSQLCVTGGMACVYLMAREFFGREESALAALAPQFIFYYNVTSPEFNVNLPLLFLWPAAALFFVRAYKHGRIRDWILLGAASGLCLLCKYTSALLFAAFAVFLLTSKARRRLLLTAGPWIAAASACVVILPHAMWALTGGIAMMRAYVEKRMAAGADVSWFRLHVAGVLLLLGNAVLVYLIPLGAFWLSKLERPRIPSDPVRREAALFSAVMTGVPLFAMTVIGISGKTIRAMWLVPLFFPLGIIMGMRFGLFTPTEAGGVGVLYCFIIGKFVYRGLKKEHFIPVFRETISGTCTVMLIIVAANLFGYYLTWENIPNNLLKAVSGIASNKYLILLILNIALLIMGMFLEGGAALIILAPLMVPLVKAAGIDLVHFGIVVNVNIMIGGLTPPFGSMMFTCVSITGSKMSEFIREVQPFILALIIALLLITYIPGISLLLPNLIY